jgi:glutamate-1-semialdehyde 2,1-aminomutase
MKIKDKNQVLYNEAKKIIPGGVMLFSKRPENYLPDKWPTYFKKAKGAYVWDLNNKKYLDMFFGVGQSILGYANSKIDNEVIKSNKSGNISSLNSFQEVELSKKLIKIHPWSGFARFAKTGGEASAIAIRIARSINNKEKIAICGYHGWHDWYLAANLKSRNNLNSHLLKGLESVGVPYSLKNTIYPFRMNNYSDFNKIKKVEKLSTIIMEVQREKLPDLSFLKEVRNFCNKKRIILIFDECTSGFRETYGGIHLKYGIYPDLLTLGKALGNGYPITCILGKKKYFKKASKTFISSTFFTEKSGVVAALATIDFMKKNQTYKKIITIGKKIKKIWEKNFKKHNLDAQIYGLDSIPCFKILSKNSNKYKTFITQEMLKNNILASNSIYISIAHKDIYLKKYEKVLDKTLLKIKECEDKKISIHKILKYKVSTTDFNRLTG